MTALLLAACEIPPLTWPQVAAIAVVSGASLVALIIVVVFVIFIMP